MYYHMLNRGVGWHEVGHPKPVLWGNIEGYSGEGGGFSMEGTHVYLWLVHVDVWQNYYNILK